VRSCLEEYDFESALVQFASVQKTLEELSA